MRESLNDVGLALCFALDGALAAHLLAWEPSARSLLATVGIHLGLSLAAGFSLAGALPRFVRATDHAAIATGALIAACVPVLGPLGMLVTARFGLTEPPQPFREQWAAFDVRQDFERSHRHPLRTRKTEVSAAAIRAALRQRTPQTAAYRFNCVLAIQKLPPKVGVPLLKLAQSDPSDEVRLYAFSRLERMRDDLEKLVTEITASLATAESVAADSLHEVARLHLRLAESYWELAYLGLAEGAVLAHALKNAHHHAATASELMPMHAPADFFLGRILLHLREPERATIAFDMAIAAGYPRIKLLPWLAECAFYERDFGSVRALLGELDVVSPENVFFQPVSDFWAERAPDGPLPLRRGSRESLRSGSDHKFIRASVT